MGAYRPCGVASIQASRAVRTPSGETTTTGTPSDAAALAAGHSLSAPPRSRAAVQAGKVARALAFLETGQREPPERLHVGHVAQACALGYLDLRFEGRWREEYPRLVAWLDDFSARVPAFEKTRFVQP